MQETFCLKNDLKKGISDDIQKNFTGRFVLVYMRSLDDLRSNCQLIALFCPHAVTSFDVCCEKKRRSETKHSSLTALLESFLLVVSRGVQLKRQNGVGIVKSPTWTTAVLPTAGRGVQ